ncbi:Piso0_004919 [Millerozyma farinosa CBS 7064]|uniref:Piso0_004919 protein n=1 Tax=Pichia sorbitophila (strain ATCC MYA-4447 / BCRC 22081 / CBS 7064 / NBRC 10061 / NRRL Y-12695) TaxID=559304 RepID=G8Y3R3_PICSO|nr:Piso0_004919 [Millerozyma farinosa CBS 7064]
MEEGNERKGSVTAVEYIEGQDQLEKEARELMPYEPDECTYTKGALRQPIFACLTCSKENGGTAIGVCYSCSIQCHSTHELVELFSKRKFVCDCGTTRMAKTRDGYCKLRRNTLPSRSEGQSITGSSCARVGRGSSVEIPAEDIPSSSNTYNQNFKGLFCSCEKQYEPTEETGNMIQCNFGFVCGEDWYHEECILGYKRDTIAKIQKKIKEEENESSRVKDPDSQYKVPHFPELEEFDSFICWKCVNAFRGIFEQFESYSDIVLCKLPHFDRIESTSTWESLFEEWKEKKEAQERPAKKPKLEKDGRAQESVFLTLHFRDRLREIKDSVAADSSLGVFLSNHDYLYLDDPIYEFPEDDQSNSGSTTSSLYDMGADALSSLPRDKALDSIHAYEKISFKLKEFLKPFADNGNIVTEQEVREFFNDIKKEN